MEPRALVQTGVPARAVKLRGASPVREELADEAHEIERRIVFDGPPAQLAASGAAGGVYPLAVSDGSGYGRACVQPA